MGLPDAIDANVIAAQAESVRTKREYIVFGEVRGESGDVMPGCWEIIGRDEAFGRDEAEEAVTSRLAADEQGGPFVTIAASAWQPREYETETITRRKPKVVK